MWVLSSVIQKEEKNKKAAENLRGTTKLARLINSPDYKDLMVMSVYDTTPVHFLSTISESLDCIQKERKVCSADNNNNVSMEFIRLGFIDTHNTCVGSVNIVDQLRGRYRPGRSMCQRKWWLLLFLW